MVELGLGVKSRLRKIIQKPFLAYLRFKSYKNHTLYFLTTMLFITSSNLQYDPIKELGVYHLASIKQAIFI